MKQMFNSNTLIVDHLYDSIKNSKNVVESFKACIKEGAWKEYKSKLDKNITHKDFIEFITADYPHGLETTPDTLRGLIKHDQEALKMFTDLIKAPVGAPVGNKNNSKINKIELDIEIKDDYIIADKKNSKNHKSNTMVPNNCIEENVDIESWAQIKIRNNKNKVKNIIEKITKHFTEEEREIIKNSI